MILKLYGISILVEEHGGKNFDNKEEYIVAFADGKVSGLAK